MNSPSRLDEVCDVVMGQAPAGEAYNSRGEGWPLIAGAADFGETYPSPKKYTTQASKLSEEGDVVLAIRATIGERVQADGVYCLGRGVAALRPRSGLDGRYLWHWLTFIRPTLAARGRGATFKQVNREDIGSLPIWLPPIADQRRVSEILDTIEVLRTRRRAALARLDTLTHSVFAEMFGNTSTNPNGWPIIGIGDACSLIVDCVNRTAPTVESPSPYKMIRTSNVKDGIIDLNEVKYADEATFRRWNRRATPKRGDVILTREAPVGEVGMLDTDEPVFLGQRLMLYRTNPRRMLPEFLLFLFREPFLQRQFSRSGSGSTVKHLPVPVCRSFQVLAPPVSLQSTFANRINTVRALKAEVEGSLAQLDELFAVLHSQAFRSEFAQPSTNGYSIA